jgi:hypothetical protein
MSRRTKRLLEQVRTKLRLVPSLFCVFANASILLEGYPSFSAALAHGTLDSKMGEGIALAVAESTPLRVLHKHAHRDAMKIVSHVAHTEIDFAQSEPRETSRQGDGSKWPTLRSMTIWLSAAESRAS